MKHLSRLQLLFALLLLAGCGQRVPEARPATAATPPAGLRFEEVAAASGLRFRWNPEPVRPLRTLDAFGCGCAFLDYDDDGYQDIILVNEPVCGLFRNEAGRGFRDVTAETGLDRARGAWKGVAAGDYDGDGRLDLLLTGFHRLALLRNREGRSFTEATAAAGLRADNWKNWAASAGFMDLDADSDLDLVVLNYVEWGSHVMQYCTFHGVRMGCPPKVYNPERGRLFRNNGNGTFTDVSARAGFPTTTGVGLVVGFADANNDAKTDFYLGNDAAPADFMENRGDLRFKNVALVNGTIYGKSAEPLAAMGVDWADYDRDGHLDFTVTAFSKAAFALFHNDGTGLFTDESAVAGIAGPTFLPLGFGAKFVDADNDGWPDIFYVNGHVYDSVGQTDPALALRQPSMLFHNQQGRSFVDLAPQLGGAFTTPILGRGSATGDFDNDGRVDLLAVDYEGGPVLLHNRAQNRNHWIKLDLRSTGKNPHAYGAHLWGRTGEDRWTAVVSPASSYLSSSDPRVHLGLGGHQILEELKIRWPGGRVEVLRNLPADRLVRVTEGRGFRETPPSPAAPSHPPARPAAAPAPASSSPG